MALTPSFTAAPTSNAAALILTDTSTGSDGAITDRQVIILNAAGGPLAGSPFDWPIAQSSITLTAFQIDQAVNITINWNNSGGTVLYTKSQLYVAVQYAEQFYYSLTQQQAATTALNILNDFPYYTNKSKLRLFIDSAIQAISVGADIFSAQFCVALYQPYLQNPNLYF